MTDIDAFTEYELQQQRAKRQAGRLLDAEEALADWDEDAIFAEEGTLADRRALERPARTWVVDGLWRERHLVLLAAASKAGKSTLIAELISALADEREALGKFATALPLGTKIGLLNSEMDDEDQLDYLDGVQRPEQVVTWTLRGRRLPFLADGPAADAFVSWMIKRQVGALIIDPLRDLISWNNLKENDNDHLNKLLKRIVELCQRAGVYSILVAHHTGWDESRARGASNLEGIPDALWNLRNDKGIRFFSARGRGVQQDETDLLYQDGMLTLPVTSRNRMQIRSETRVAEVVKLVGENRLSAKGAIKTLMTTTADNTERTAAINRALDEGRIHVATKRSNAELLDVGPGPQWRP